MDLERYTSPDGVVRDPNGELVSFNAFEKLRVAQDSAIEQLEATVNKLQALIREVCMVDEATGEVAYGEFDEVGRYTPPSALPNIPKMESAIAKMSHRLCWDCKHIAYYASPLLPFCKCEKCGSEDTRLIR